MSSAHVLSIQTLEEFKGHLTRFDARAQEVLNAAEIEIRRTLDWLHERLNYWRNEVNRRREIYNRAWAAYQRCLESRRTRDKNGNFIQFPCPAEEAALERARLHLAEAEAELRTAQEWTRLVERQSEEYHRQAQRLKAWLGGELPKANAFLERKITTLQSYVAMGISSGGYVTTPPLQAAGETFATAVGLAALGMGLSAAAIAVIHWLATDIRHALGAVGEELSARLVREQPGFQELPFDPPKHGFDRVFTAPGLPLIVLESKVSSIGRFHPGQTQHGEQGSPEWIAAQAEKMADPTSAQWSPANERIAALVKELGPENAPTVAVVIQSETGLADVHVRSAGSEGWQPLREGVSLSEALAGTRAEAGLEDKPNALPAWQFEALGSGTNARYDAGRDAILLDTRLQKVREPMLLAPLLTHEAVHRRYRSDPPQDEASLQRYLDEEMEAYRAQLDAWLQVKESFAERYPDPAAMLNEVERDLLSDYLQLELALQDESTFRASRLAHYRRVMADRQNEEQ